MKTIQPKHCFAFMAGVLLLLSELVLARDYQPPENEAPPIAPPPLPGSPLEHLMNAPKLTELPYGYKEGDTTGEAGWIAHRQIDDCGGKGWGWLKKSGEDWTSAKWVALLETPGLAVAPHRKLIKAEADKDWEFRFWGSIASYNAYDPAVDEQLPVFIIKGYEVIGPAAPLAIKLFRPRLQLTQEFSYEARLSDFDKRNSNGVRLIDATDSEEGVLREILLQDRANYYTRNICDPEDKPSPGLEHPSLNRYHFLSREIRLGSGLSYADVRDNSIIVRVTFTKHAIIIQRKF